MLDLETVRKISTKAVQAVLPARRVKDVSSAEIIDSVGTEALQIEVVLNRISDAQLRKLPFVAVDQAISGALRDAGEPRFAFVRYATEADLRDDADPES